ncbi:MAG: methyltransferase domain-containing protein [bacterium]
MKINIIIKINSGPFGSRCIRCFSTFIHRGIATVLKQLPYREDMYVYELSAHGALFKMLKKQYKYFTYSEYLDGVAPGTLKNGILCQDIQKLNFFDNSFDLVTSTEVFEHVPDDGKGFAQVYRVLKPDGMFVFTVPIDPNSFTVERAYIENGKVISILEPEIHGDHLRGGGILAYRNYGKDIVERLEKVGFREAGIKTITDIKHGIHKSHVVIAKKL